MILPRLIISSTSSCSRHFLTKSNSVVGRIYNINFLLSISQASTSTKSLSSLAVNIIMTPPSNILDSPAKERTSDLPCSKSTTTNKSCSVSVSDIEELHLQALQNQLTSYIDPNTGFTVFTELLHLKRGSCCGNECRHCPYGYDNVHEKRRQLLLDTREFLPKTKLVDSGETDTAQQIIQKIMHGDISPVLISSLTTSVSDDTSTTGAISSYMSPINPNDTMVATDTKLNSKSIKPTKNVPYTRKGDTGTSQLGTGERRSKCDCNFEALGCVDELCSVVGMAHALLDFQKYDYGLLEEQLLNVMSRLFDIGSHVAKPRIMAAKDNDDTAEEHAFEPNGIGGGFDAVHIDDLEDWINEMTEALPELTSFILPTGAKGAAQMHVARTVCRRAERRVVPLVVEDRTCDPNALTYLNRLSDYFFVAARWINYCEGKEEIEYRRQTKHTKQRERVHRSLK